MIARDKDDQRDSIFMELTAWVFTIGIIYLTVKAFF